MTIITKESIVNDAPERWRRSYFKTNNERHKGITKRLMDLKEPINSDEVEAIIGNKSWTQLDSCGECNKRPSDKIIQIGEEPEYESYTAYICVPCLKMIANNVR